MIPVIKVLIAMIITTATFTGKAAANVCELMEASKYVYTFTEQEEWEMTHVAMCEGGNQGIEGIAMIYRVILNRVEDPKWPDNIHDVIYQPGQFTVVGYMDSKEPNEDCYEAFEMIRLGWDESNGVEHFWGDGRVNHFY